VCVYVNGYRSTLPCPPPSPPFFSPLYPRLVSQPLLDGPRRDIVSGKMASRTEPPTRCDLMTQNRALGVARCRNVAAARTKANNYFPRSRSARLLARPTARCDTKARRFTSNGLIRRNKSIRAANQRTGYINVQRIGRRCLPSRRYSIMPLTRTGYIFHSVVHAVRARANENHRQ